MIGVTHCIVKIACHTTLVMVMNDLFFLGETFLQFAFNGFCFQESQTKCVRNLHLENDKRGTFINVITVIIN